MLLCALLHAKINLYCGMFALCVVRMQCSSVHMLPMRWLGHGTSAVLSCSLFCWCVKMHLNSANICENGLDERSAYWWCCLIGDRATEPLACLQCENFAMSHVLSTWTHVMANCCGKVCSFVDVRLSACPKRELYNCRHCAHQVWSLFIECFGPWVLDARISRVANLKVDVLANLMRRYTKRTEIGIIKYIIGFHSVDGSLLGALKRARDSSPARIVVVSTREVRTM